jgi:hypothetical protein
LLLLLLHSLFSLFSAGSLRSDLFFTFILFLQDLVAVVFRQSLNKTESSNNVSSFNAAACPAASASKGHTLPYATHDLIHFPAVKQHAVVFFDFTAQVFDFFLVVVVVVVASAAALSSSSSSEWHLSESAVVVLVDEEALLLLLLEWLLLSLLSLLLLEWLLLSLSLSSPQLLSPPPPSHCSSHDAIVFVVGDAMIFSFDTNGCCPSWTRLDDGDDDGTWCSSFLVKPPSSGVRKLFLVDLVLVAGENELIFLLAPLAESESKTIVASVVCFLPDGDCCSLSLSLSLIL